MRLLPKSWRWPWQQSAPPLASRGGNSQSTHFQNTQFSSPLGIGSNVGEQIQYAVIDKMVRNIPFLDVGLRKFGRMVNGFGVLADNDTLQEGLDEFLASVEVDWIQKGFRSYESRLVRELMQYGLALGEVVLDDPGREIACLVNINSPEVRLKREENAWIIGQQDCHSTIPTFFENQELLQYNLSNPEGDSPLGTPLLRSAPWVADIVMQMERSLKQMWWRSGAPSFHISAEIDPENLGPTVGQTDIDNIRSGLESNWNDGMEQRFTGTGIPDFITAGTFKLNFAAIGADVKELDFQIPFRSLMEQVLSTIELAPFMLGIQWATTERLSQQQGDAVVACVDDVRAELEPDYLMICELFQQLSGMRGSFKAKWQEFSLQDRVENARAESIEAVAAKTREATATRLWSNGTITQEEYHEMVTGEELESVPVPMEAPIPATPAGGGGLALAAPVANAEGSNGKRAAER